MNALYDTIGKGYARYRRPDPRIAEAIDKALGDARSVVNIGAGSGSYEPVRRDLVAVEISREMIEQRAPHAAPVVQASAIALPFADDAFDASLAILTIHHWPDQVAGLREMKRVARQRCVVLSWLVPDEPFWLTEDYFPEIMAHDRTMFTLDTLREAFGTFEVLDIPVPHDCIDGFLCAYWRRPAMYLDPGARAAISSFPRLGDISARLDRLEHDIADGSWARKNAHLLDRTEMDYGYRIIIASK